jgi:hypothetical protein
MGRRVDAPESRLANIRQPRAELEAKQPEQPKDNVGVYMDTLK